MHPWLCFNPLTPRALFLKSINFLKTFWRFSGWIWAKLAPVYSKRHLQLDSMPFFPLALPFTAFLFGHVQKSKFLDEKVTYVFIIDFFSPFLFLLLSFCFSVWPPMELAFSSKNSEKAWSSWAMFTSNSHV